MTLRFKGITSQIYLAFWHEMNDIYFSTVNECHLSWSCQSQPWDKFGFPTLLMLFRRWTLLSVCQEDLSCKIDVKCLGDEPSWNNTGQLIHTWPLSPHQKYMATGHSNMQWPISTIEEDECYMLSPHCILHAKEFLVYFTWPLIVKHFWEWMNGNSTLPVISVLHVCG